MKIIFSRPVLGHVEQACQMVADRVNTNGLLGTWHNAVGKDDHAIGDTWERINGIKANTRQGPDEHISAMAKQVGFEHKAGLLDTKSMGSLFCKEADGRGSNRFAIETYHQLDSEGERHCLYATLVVGRPTTIGGCIMELHLDGDGLVVTGDGNPFLEWSEKTLGAAATKKLDHVVARVKGEERFENGVRQFRYSALTFHTGFAYSNLLDAFREGHAAIDFRCYFTGESLKSGKPEIRNHGTAIRMRDSRIPSLFGAMAKAA